MISYATSLDTVGIMARNVRDVELTHGEFERSIWPQSKLIEPFSRRTTGVLAQFDSKDPTSVSEAVRSRSKETHSSWSRRQAGDLTGLRVGVPLVSGRKDETFSFVFPTKSSSAGILA